MKKFTLTLTIFLTALSTILFSQGQSWRWQFGTNAGLNFVGGGAPVAAPGGAMSTFEGCASIGTAAGALAMYTDGNKVWNSAHVQMPNGFGLFGNSSTTQAAVIVPRPGSPNLYYVFCSSSNFSPGTLSYSEVDMTLLGGMGNVTATKNVVVGNNIAEKLTAVRHCNGVDIWVIVHDYTNSDYRAYLVTAAGVSGVPVVSTAGAPCSGNVVGVIKTSPDGKRIAYCASNGPFALHVADFNNATGVVSNAINLAGNFNLQPMYGLEFSADSKILYGSKWAGSNQVYQWNLCAANANAVISSSLMVGSGGNTHGQMQLGPNGRIYIARAGAQFLGVINNPNTLGVGCGYVANGVSISPNSSQYGLPTFIQSYLKQPPPPFTSTVACNTASFTAPTASQIVTGCTTSTVNAISGYVWNFGHPASGPANTSTLGNPIHIYNGPGTYSVSLIINYPCGADTVKQNITVVAPGITVTPAAKTCSAMGSATASIGGGQPPITYTWSGSASTTSVATGLNNGTQTVSISDVTGCSNTATFTVGFLNTMSATATGSNVLCNGQTTGSASILVSGGSGNYTYNWSNGQTTTLATNLGANTYSVIAVDGLCTATAAVTITEPPALSLTIVSNTTNVCAGKTINTNGQVGGGTTPYGYTWTPAGPNTSAYNVTESVAGNYNYGLNVVDANGCPISGNINLTFNPIPLVTVSSQTICYNDKGVLNANGAEYYHWAPVNFVGSTYTTTGITNLYLTVVGTNTSTGCSSLPVVSTLVVNPLPTPVISQSNNKGCVPLCMTFTASNSGGGVQSVSWDFGDGAFATNVISTDRCYTIPGNYIVKATITDNNGCVNFITDSLESYPIPVADFNFAPLKPIINDEVTFTDATFNAPIAKWDWYFMNIPKPHSGLQNPTYTYTEAGTYAVALFVTSKHGCVDTIVKTIVVGEDFGLYVPNIFTPNGDGLNDVFQPKGFGITKYELRIFNRWGEQLMYTNDFNQGWDGMHKGKLSKEDTYVWKINVINVFGRSKELTGNVILMK